MRNLLSTNVRERVLALLVLGVGVGCGEPPGGVPPDAGSRDGATDAAICEGIPTGGGGCRCVGGSHWELSFDSDPTSVDANLDGLPDWRMRDGEGFDASELSGGVWASSGRALDTNPDAPFDVSTSVHLRYRSATVGEPGAVFWINTAPADGRVASVHADLSLQDDGTQELVIYGRDGDDVELARFASLGTDFIDLWLELDPETSTLTVWLEGEMMGSYPHPTTAGAPADTFASLLGWGSRAEFDFVRIESCPDGAATPDRRVPPTCAETGGVMCGGACVDPNRDEAYCGASGDCTAANAGTTCDPSETCRSGACTATEPRPTPDLIVALDGTDASTCGAAASPCRTIEYAVETRATSGQLVGVMPGTYDETGTIEVPRTVSITGMGSDASAVVVRPNFAMDITDYFIELMDSDLSQEGRQSISFLTFEAHADAHTGSSVLHVQNRNGVRIHHCRFTNWDREKNPFWLSPTIHVNTTYGGPSWQTHEFWHHYPDDLGPPGDYSTWTDWPTDPVTNFRFDHNYVYRSSAARHYIPGVSADTDRAAPTVRLTNLQDSRIHHNEFDSRGLLGTAIAGIAGYWNNVDVHDNIFRSTDAHQEGWFGPNPTWSDLFVVEVWAHINGCEYYNNIANDGFSIMRHKDGSIHHNILLRESAAAIAIETGPLHYSTVHHNYVVGGNGGIATQYDRASAYTQGALFDNIVVGIHGWGMGVSVNRAFCRGDGLTDMAVYHNIVDTTFWGTFRIRSDCQTRTPPVDMFVRNNTFINGGEGWGGVSFELGPTYTALRATVENNLLYNNAAGTETTCRCIDTSNRTVTCEGACDGRAASNTVNEDPRFMGPDIIVVNESDATGTSVRGSWDPATSADLRRYRDDARVHSGGGGDHFEFSADGLPTDSPTLIAIWWPRGEGRASAVPITIYDGDGTTPIATYEVDQASWDSSEWYYLGMHTFASGRSRVRVNSVAGAQVVADAVLWSKLGRGYELRSDSPAIDQGSAATTSVVRTDFFGNPVPSGSAPDIGVHER